MTGVRASHRYAVLVPTDKKCVGHQIRLLALDLAIQGKYVPGEFNSAPKFGGIRTGAIVPGIKTWTDKLYDISHSFKFICGVMFT
jgi:hypothetical protein